MPIGSGRPRVRPGAPARRSLRRAVGLTVAAVFLASCTQANQAVEAPDATASGPVDLASYTEQEVDWQECPGSDKYLDLIPPDARCATVRVPVDYADVGSGRGDLEIALVRISADGDAAGDLLVNPGGPGASGFDFAVNSAEDFRRNFPGYNIVGFDPRGVQRSAGFDCGMDTEERVDRIRADFSPESQQEYDEVEAFLGDYEQQCREEYAAWAFLGTASVTRDMHVISRAVTGKPLNYYGASYGTELGYEYLREFPEDIGRMILESPVDPSVEEVLADQLAEFNDRVEDLLAVCATEQADTCGKGRSTAGVRAEFMAALADIESDSYTGLDPEGVSERLVYYGMVLPLYWEATQETDDWYVEAIAAVINDDDASFFEYWGYLYEGYDVEQSEFDQSEDIFELVLCLDESTPTEDLDLEEEKAKVAAEEQSIRERAPIFYALAFSGAIEDDRSYEACSYALAAFADDTLPDPPPKAPEVANPGEVPVLVLGISGDTATPYAWAQTVADQLGVPLVTQDATGHAIYSSTNNRCTRAIVVRYLETGELPAEPTTC